MKAGRDDNTQADEERADFGTDISEADEEYQDDEALIGVMLCLLAFLSMRILKLEKHLLSTNLIFHPHTKRESQFELARN